MIIPIRDHKGRGMPMTFLQLVMSALLSRQDKWLDKLQVKGVPSDTDVDYIYASALIGLAISRHVRVLDLQLYRREGYQMFSPEAIFKHEKLESLTLSGYFILQLPSAVRLPKLHTLKLSHVYHDQDDAIQELVSGSPVLRYLYIFENHLDADRSYKISSSSLRYLEIHFDDFHDCSEHGGQFQKLEIDTPNLEHLIVDDFLCRVTSVTKMTSLYSSTLYLTCMVDWDAGFDNGPDDRFNSTVKLVESLSSVKNLTIREDALMALSLATIPFSTCFNRLTELHIHMDCCYWSSLSAIFFHAIQLQVLKLDKYICDNINHEICWVDPEKVPECLSSSLVRVSIKGIQGVEDEMAMVRYILKHGSVLKSVELVSGIELDFEDKFRTAQKILMFPRASGAYSIKFE